MKVKSTATDKNIDGGDSSCVIWHQNQLFSGNDNGTVKVWDTNEAKLILEKKAHDYPIYHMLSDVKNNRILTCSSDMKILDWNWSNGELGLVRSFEGQHTDTIRKLCINEDYLFSGDETGEIIVWHYRDGTLASQINIQEEIWDLIVKGNMMVSVRDKDVLISEIRRKDEKVSISTKMTIGGRSPLFLSDDLICFVDRGGMNILVHKNQPGFPFSGKLQGHTMIINAITGSGNLLYSGGWDKQIKAWDLNTLSQIGEVQLDYYINSLSLDPSLTKLFAAGQEGLISIIDLKM